MEDTLKKLKKLNLVKGETDWFRFRWKPLKNETYNFYKIQHCYLKSVGFQIDFGGNQGQYGFQYKQFGIGIDLYWYSFYFWIHWKIIASRSLL